MDKAEQTMLTNLFKNTGKTLEEWVSIVKSGNFEKHGQIVNFLKEEHGITHGYANMIAHSARQSDASVVDNDELINSQYKGKEDLKKIYDQLLSEIEKFGKDIEIAPKKAYVSLRRTKQFATLNPVTKTRFEIGINLKGQEPKGKLEPEKPNAMCSHKINLSTILDIDKEVIEWIKFAYENAG